MTSVKIRISTISDVKEFIETAMHCDYDIDVISGRYAIDAKSIMGVFSLDLSKDLELRIHSDDCGEFIDEIRRFIVDE